MWASAGDAGFDTGARGLGVIVAWRAGGWGVLSIWVCGRCCKWCRGIFLWKGFSVYCVCLVFVSGELLTAPEFGCFTE